MKRLKHDRYFDNLVIIETESEWQIFSYSSHIGTVHIATVSRTSMELTSLGSDYNYSSTTSKHLRYALGFLMAKINGIPVASLSQPQYAKTLSGFQKK